MECFLFVFALIEMVNLRFEISDPTPKSKLPTPNSNYLLWLPPEALMSPAETVPLVGS
jgi:hypothetical protein